MHSAGLAICQMHSAGLFGQKFRRRRRRLSLALSPPPIPLASSSPPLRCPRRHRPFQDLIFIRSAAARSATAAAAGFNVELHGVLQARRPQARPHALLRGPGAPRPPVHQQQQGQLRLEGGAGQLRPPRPRRLPLPSDFAECIGMTESKEFALELFDTLNRRRQMKLDTISKEELREIWQKITDNSFDSRLLIFSDICSTGEAEEQDQGDPGRWPRGVKRSREVEEQIQHRRSWAARLSWALAEYRRGRRKQPRLEICRARLAARWKGIWGEMGGEVLAGDLGRAAVSIPGEDDAVVAIQIKGSDVIS